METIRNDAFSKVLIQNIGCESRFDLSTQTLIWKILEPRAIWMPTAKLINSCVTNTTKFKSNLEPKVAKKRFYHPAGLLRYQLVRLSPRTLRPNSLSASTLTITIEKVLRKLRKPG